MTPKIVNGSYAALFEEDVSASNGNKEELMTEFKSKINHMRKEIEGQGSVVRRWILNDTRRRTIAGSSSGISFDAGHAPLQRQGVSVWGPRIPLSIATKPHKNLMGLKQFSLDCHQEEEEEDLSSLIARLEMEQDEEERKKLAGQLKGLIANKK